MTTKMNILRALALAAAMALALFPAAAPALADSGGENSVSLWDGGEDAPDLLSGAGRSASDPIIIDSAAKLAGLSRLTADGKSFRGVYFRLDTDIDLGRIPWTPIGSADAPFEGIFDGGGHTVKGMYVCNQEYAGLFGSIESYGVVSRLYVEGNIFASGEQNQCFAGGIAGLCAGRISGCYYRGTIDVSALGSCYAGGIAGGLGGKISASVSYAAVITGKNGANTAKTGGIAGYSSGGGIENCRSDGQVTANAKNLALAGGIVGDNYSGNITGCISKPVIYAKAAECLAGGVAGQLQSGRIDGCSNERGVTADGTSSSASGGVAGRTDGYITNSSNAGDAVSVGGTSGGIAGIAGANASILNCYSTGAAEFGLAAESSGVLDNCYSAGTAALTGNGSADNCLSISLSDDIEAICDLLNARASELGAEFSAWRTDRERTGYPVFDSSVFVTASAGAGGSISPSGRVFASSGDSLTFEIVPAEGCVVSAVIVDGVNVGSMMRYTFGNLVCGHTIEAVFAGAGERTVTIVSQAGAGGSITPDGFAEAAVGRDITYEIRADEGYSIGSVTVDGEEVGAVREYTFTAVSEPHTIEASFVRSDSGEPASQGGRFTITSSSGEGGSIEFEGEISVSGGESLTLSITPDTGWSIKSVCVDGEELGAIESYTFENISANHTITAEFDINAAGGEPAPQSPPEDNTGGGRRALWLLALIPAALGAGGYILWRKSRSKPGDAENSGAKE